MNIMDAVQIAILLLVILMILKPFYTRWLPAQWHAMVHRLIPPRWLKYRGTWQRNTTNRDDDK